MQSPILGGQYTLNSLDAADNRMINLFPEVVLEGGKSGGILQRCPGLLPLLEVGSGPIRGLHRIKKYFYVVSGEELYEVDKNYTATLLGHLHGNDPVSMSDNGTQLFIAANPGGYIYNVSTEVFGQIIDVDFQGAGTVDYLDGYFIFTEPRSQKFWVTSLLDGTSIDALEFASAESSPDNLITAVVSHKEVWLFGEDSTEVWYNSQELDFPLSPIQGAFFEIGCLAAQSVKDIDNSLIWLGSDKNGHGMVYRANGYSGIRISDHSVESIIQNLYSVSDAIAYTYQQAGHSFYALTFPFDGRTLVYDMATNKWHERAGFVDGHFVQHKITHQINFNNSTIVGGEYDGQLYIYDHKTFTDGAEEQKWLRSWRALSPEQESGKRVIYHQLELLCKAGVGLNSGQGSDPQVMLRWSDDGGETWSNEHWKSLGKLGNTAKRIYWTGLGASRDRIFELSGTDPVQITIQGVEIRVTQLAT